MRFALLSLSALLALGSFVACVGDDPTFDAGTEEDAGSDTSTRETDSGADAFVATDTGAADAADAAPPTPMTWTCTTVVSGFAKDTTHASTCSDGTLHESFSYTAHQDALGNVSVSASATTGSGTPVMGMMTWAAGTAGATHATVSFTDDVCTGAQAPQAGSLAFSLEKPSTTLTIVYTDADLNAPGSATYTAACTVMNN